MEENINQNENTKFTLIEIEGIGLLNKTRSNNVLDICSDTGEKPICLVYDNVINKKVGLKIYLLNEVEK